MEKIVIIPIFEIKRTLNHNKPVVTTALCIQINILEMDNHM